MEKNNDDDRIACRTARGAAVLVARSALQFRPGAYAIIERDGKVLMMRSKYGKYFLPGGGLDKGELLHDCLTREVREETGLIVSVGRFLCVTEELTYWLDTKQAWHVLAHAFAAECAADAKIDESLGCDSEGYPEWIPLIDLTKHPEKLQSPTISCILQVYLYGS